METLRRNHANFTLLKEEGPVVRVKEVIDQTAGTLAVFNGRAGLELPDCLRAGCAEIIPPFDCADVQVRVYELMASGDPDDELEAEKLYREILPLIVFTMQSLDTLLCYGKQVTAHRLGLRPRGLHANPLWRPPYSALPAPSATARYCGRSKQYSPHLRRRGVDLPISCNLATSVSRFPALPKARFEVL